MIYNTLIPGWYNNFISKDLFYELIILIPNVKQGYKTSKIKMQSSTELMRNTALNIHEPKLSIITGPVHKSRQNLPFWLPTW